MYENDFFINFDKVEVVMMPDDFLYL